MLIYHVLLHRRRPETFWRTSTNLTRADSTDDDWAAVSVTAWVPGWVTAVSLCCFCNVALIFATMKTFILQQVKCCHLSPFLLGLNPCRAFPHSVLSLTQFYFIFYLFLFLYHEFSSASFITCPSFRRSHQTPSLTCSSFFSDRLPLYLSKSGS